jgi:hypothetical protein
MMNQSAPIAARMDLYRRGVYTPGCNGNDLQLSCPIILREIKIPSTPSQFRTGRWDILQLLEHIFVDIFELEWQQRALNEIN